MLASAPAKPLCSPRMVSVGPQRGDGIAGTGLDPEVRRAGGEAEHQQRIRPMLRQQFRQFAIDGPVGHRKDVAGQLDIAERRTAQPQQARHQRLRRIIGRTGKRAEAGDEDAEFVGHFIAISPRSAPPRRPG